MLYYMSARRESKNGGIAQLARAIGSYPIGHGFKSNFRYHFRPVGQEVKTPPFHGSNMGSIPVRVTKKDNIRTFSSDVIFLSKPQAWYGITRQRVWNRRRRMASPKVHSLRLDSIRDFVAIPYRNQLRITYTPSA